MSTRVYVWSNTLEWTEL